MTPLNENTNLLNVISMINGMSVGIFGMVLSAAFCDILWTRKKRWLVTGCMAGLLLLQGLVYLLLDYEAVRYLYPVIMHVPLAIVLCVFSKKRLWPIVSVFTAYLCCRLRRWLALLIVALCSGDAMLQGIMELVLTLPLLLVLVRFAAPAVRSLSCYSGSVQCQFGLIPLLSYVFDYLTRVYTDVFSDGTPVVEEFMAFICSAAYLVFVLRTTQERQMRSQLELVQDNLNLQVTQAVREIELLRESQNRASAYRHDLRHHMQYLASCIENGRTGQAQAYIQGICSEIEAGKVTVFCENEGANLIFSAFAGRAVKLGIPLNIRAELTHIIPVSESDLCVLLSNALENALHACQKLAAKGLPAEIEVMVYEKNGKLFLQIVNSCEENISFENGIPVTNNPGHGMGVRSICALVERHGGIYTFAVHKKQFILRISL